MYLALILIVVAILVFYNEINSKMNIAEYALLAIALIAIIRAAYNYIQIDKLTEGFQARPANKKRPNKNNSNDDEMDEILNSEESDEYLDTEKDSNSFTNMNSEKNSEMNNNSTSTNNESAEHVKSDEAVNAIDNILGKGKNNTTKEKMADGESTGPDNEIQSMFVPQVLVGQSQNGGNGFGSLGAGGDWRKAYQADGMTFNDTMNPTHNLWGDDHSYYDQWTRSMDAYNKGRWNPNQYKRPSDYIDYHNPARYGTNTPDSDTNNNATSSDKKQCAGYDNLDVDKDGNLLVREYKYAKKYFPGYTYVPPDHWDVPQKRAGVCREDGPNVRKLTGLVDRGLPINALELNPDGSIADEEADVKLTNVGSIMPKFKYFETPFSRPYI